MRTTVFLGGGRITSALVAGLRLARYSLPIVVHDRHEKKLRELKHCYPSLTTESDLHRAVAQAGFLIIAVRPDSVAELLEEIGPIMRPLTAVSLAAGIPLAKLHTRLGRRVRWARAMPSPASRTGRGLTAVAFDRNFPRAQRRDVRKFFSQVGAVLEIPESKFDAFTVTYSCSHGYHALAALAEAAEKVGLDRKSAFTAAAHALADGVFCWREANVSLASMLQEAATPAGIAATVMDVMNSAGYTRLVERGLRAGLVRAQANASLPRVSRRRLARRSP